jgi:hypothetical protein
MSFKNLEGQTVCWIQRLQGYNFTSSIAKAGSITVPMPCHDDPAGRSVPTATKSRHGQTSNKCELLQP